MHLVEAVLVDRELLRPVRARRPARALGVVQPQLVVHENTVGDVAVLARAHALVGAFCRVLERVDPLLAAREREEPERRLLLHDVLLDHLARLAVEGALGDRQRDGRERGAPLAQAAG